MFVVFVCEKFTKSNNEKALLVHRRQVNLI